MSQEHNQAVHHNDIMKKVVSNKRILCVGLANVDNVVICSSYPEEDSGGACVIGQRTQVGCNAANNCTVLAALGINCEFLGTLSNCSNTTFITEHFNSCGIHFDHCVYHASHVGGRVFPNTTIIINDSNGSRTILHYRKDWPEITLRDFKRLNLNDYSWIHFEGRNVKSICSIMKFIQSWREANPTSQLRISVELEVALEETAELIPLADVVVVGKDYAIYRGCQTMLEAVELISAEAKPSATIIVPWGEKGATARGPDGIVVKSPPFPPPKVIDTLGAGDTFCAATIAALNSDCNLEESITFGCKVAGAKVGMYGYQGLQIFSRNVNNV